MLTAVSLAGYVVGALLVIGVLLGIVDWLLRREHRKRLQQEHDREVLDRIVSRPSQAFRGLSEREGRRRSNGR